MEILPTIIVPPTTAAASPGVDPGGDDPFLALLAGLFQAALLPVPPPVVSGPSGSVEPTAPAPLSAAAPPPLQLPSPVRVGEVAAWPDPAAQSDIPPDRSKAPAKPPPGTALQPAIRQPPLPNSSLLPASEAPSISEGADEPATSERSPPPKHLVRTDATATATAGTAPPSRIALVASRSEPGSEHDGDGQAADAGQPEAAQVEGASTDGTPPLAAGPEPTPAAPTDPAGAPTATTPPDAGGGPAATTPLDAGGGPIRAFERAIDAPPVQPSPPVRLPDLDDHGRAVTARLVVVDGAEGSRVRIDLEPADLGRVEVALRLDDAGTAAASFTVDRPETLQLLQRDARTVNDMLNAAGFTVDQGGLDFSLRDPGSRENGSGHQPAGRGLADGESDAPANEPAPLNRRGLLDLRV